MPRLSVWMVRTSFLYLVTGFTLGGLLLWNKGAPISPGVWSLLPAHIETLLMGWLIQLAMGVAFWILPRFERNPRRDNTHLAWAAYWFINAGIGVVVIGSLLTFFQGLSLTGRLLEISGAVAFAAHAWPRIRPSRI